MTIFLRVIPNEQGTRLGTGGELSHSEIHTSVTVRQVRDSIRQLGGGLLQGQTKAPRLGTPPPPSWTD